MPIRLDIAFSRRVFVFIDNDAAMKKAVFLEVAQVVNLHLCIAVSLLFFEIAKRREDSEEFSQSSFLGLFHNSGAILLGQNGTNN